MSKIVVPPIDLTVYSLLDPMSSFSCGIHSSFVHNKVKNKFKVGLKINEKEIPAGNMAI